MTRHLAVIAAIAAIATEALPSYALPALAGTAEPLPPRYAIFDVDGDGTLGPQEVGPVIRRDFARLDRDGDGVLRTDELEQPLMAELTRRRMSKVPVTEPHPTPDTDEATTDDFPTFASVTAYLAETLELGQLAGIALRIERGNELLYEHTLGDLSPETVVPVASGSKWMTSALLMTLVDDGVVDLDGPLSAYLPFLKGMPAEPVTLRQTLSHTGGFDSEHLLWQPFDMDLTTSAQALAATELETEPGTTFHYTGIAMQFAAAAAQAATGRSWSELFTERIAGPIGMSHTAYGHPMRSIDFVGNRNQIAESGVHTTLHDYARFLEMMAGRGAFRGRRILSAEAVRQMETDQTHGLTVGFTPAGARRDWDYGLGLWCEEATSDWQCTRMNSAGAMGAFPWVDRTRGIQGVLLVVDGLPRLLDRILRLRELVEQTVDRLDTAAGGDVRH